MALRPGIGCLGSYRYTKKETKRKLKRKNEGKKMKKLGIQRRRHKEKQKEQ